MSSIQTPRLSIVIVSYNVCDLVLEGISSVYKFLQFPFEIILVDNNSSDATVNEVQEKFPEVLLISNLENKGFSFANNQGFEKCTGDLILMLNPDASLKDDSLNRMIEDYISQKRENLFYGPKLLNKDLSFQESCWKFPNLSQHVLELFFLHTTFKLSSYKLESQIQKSRVDFLSGACILFNRSALVRLKGLDPDLFWMDDVDFCKRNLDSGGENWYYSQASVCHLIGKSAEKNFSVVISNQLLSKLKYYRKHREFFNYISSCFIFVLHTLSRILVFLPLSFFKPIFSKKCKAYIFTLKQIFLYFFGKKTKLSP